MTTKVQNPATQTLRPLAANAAQQPQQQQQQMRMPDPFRNNPFEKCNVCNRGRGADAPPGPSARAAGFAVAHPGSALLVKYDGDFKKMAKDFGISGKKDVKTFSSAMQNLQQASAQATPAAAGQTPGKGQLKLSPEQIERIQAAPSIEAKKAEVMKAISAQTGVGLDGAVGKKGGKAASEALNKLFGTKIKNGREKNAGAGVTLDAIAESVARTIDSRNRGIGGGGGGEYFPLGANAAAPNAASPLAWNKGGNEPDGKGGGSRGKEAVMMDLSDYQKVAEQIAELHSPLVFDLAGTGLKIRDGEQIEIDVDGDGQKEIITDLDKGIGLLVFDSKCGDDDGAGRDYFGDRTDLSAYGIRPSRTDGTWGNGFEALRALCEHFELVHGDKQYLDANDLMFLESEVGLRMRIDGVFGSDRTFAEVKITRIDLGRPDRVQSLRRAESDAFGNKLMRCDGATFVVDGHVREYADIWFNVLARVADDISRVATVKRTPTRGLAGARDTP